MNAAPDLNPFRPTKQRQVMLEELAKANHPTACELYERVRLRLHRIGLGTIYRNLELMAASGIILKLEVGGSQKRYDAQTEPHYHIRCSRCGLVENIDMHVIQNVIAAASRKTAYNIIGHHIEFTGECPKCQRKARNACLEQERSFV
ncbi:Fur family transcriptional regulator [Candidatus Electronema sp. TJ]|uniref:Fur family transcriptional regulator n=1 Tax=Candidatus Electronema sp. TJ TaxID=3401573 RepID=UPI003AA86056